MPRLTPCDTPPQAALAFYNPSDIITPTAHYDTIRDQLLFWKDVGTQAENAVNIVMYRLSGEVIDRFSEAAMMAILAAGDTSQQARHLAECSRRSALGLAGTSLLLRRLAVSPETTVDAIGAGEADMLFDSGADDTGMPYEDRVHLLPEAAEQLLTPTVPGEEWFYDGELYVSRVAPATDQVRGRMILYAQEHKIPLNPEGLVTLSGFLPSRHTEHPAVG